MGFGTEILFMLLLGLVALGPKRLQGMLGHAVRAKAELENATRGIKSQLSAEFDAAYRDGKTDCSLEPVGHQ
jgi:Sec-independent protein translocase protein TatA